MMTPTMTSCVQYCFSTNICFVKTFNDKYDSSIYNSLYCGWLDCCNTNRSKTTSEYTVYIISNLEKSMIVFSKWIHFHLALTVPIKWTYKLKTAKPKQRRILFTWRFNAGNPGIPNLTRRGILGDAVSGITLSWPTMGLGPRSRQTRV